MDTKRLRVEIKDESQGLVRAVFSTFNVIDSDRDVTLPGAFTDGAPVRISAYNHRSWDDALPVGKGMIHADDHEAILDGEFFMTTSHGRDTFETVKQLGPLAEWSYGYDVLDAEPGTQDGRAVQFLKRLAVHEVSPVLRGAGVNTRTLEAKGAKGAVGVHHTDTSTGSWDASAVVAAIPNDASARDLRSVFAWTPDGSDFTKSACKFPHHNGVGGAANLRACSAGIAVLNGGRGGASIPDADRRGVYNHLAAHLRDADRDVPELSAGPAGEMKLSDELLLALAGVGDALDSASRVAALRAEKGKALSGVNAEILGWIDDDLARLRSLLGSTITDPSGDAEREFARFIAANL